MANATNFLETSVMDHILRFPTFSKPTNIAIGLTQNNPTSGQGVTYNEIGNGNGYARVPGASGNAFWSQHVVDGPMGNLSVISFDQATGDWGYASGVIIADSPTYSGGNILFAGPLTTPRVVQNGDTFQFAISGLQITAD